MGWLDKFDERSLQKEGDPVPPRSIGDEQDRTHHQAKRGKAAHDRYKRATGDPEPLRSHSSPRKIDVRRSVGMCRPDNPGHQ
jgi:hypothetical protein